MKRAMIRSSDSTVERGYMPLSKETNQVTFVLTEKTVSVGQAQNLRGLPSQEDGIIDGERGDTKRSGQRITH